MALEGKQSPWKERALGLSATASGAKDSSVEKRLEVGCASGNGMGATAVVTQCGCWRGRDFGGFEPQPRGGLFERRSIFGCLEVRTARNALNP